MYLFQAHDGEERLGLHQTSLKKKKKILLYPQMSDTLFLPSIKFQVRGRNTHFSIQLIYTLSIIVWLLREQRLPGLIEIPFPPRFSLLAAPASSQLILSSLFLGGITFLSSPARSLLTTPARSLSAGGSLQTSSIIGVSSGLLGSFANLAGYVQ